MKDNITALKKEFPALNAGFGGKKLVYLDSACTVLKLRCAADEQRRHLLELGGCGGKRSVHALAAAMEENFYAARSRAASFMGAGSPEEIIFTSGVTDAINLLANSFPFTPERNEVILSPLEHNAVFLPFERLAAAGKIKLRVAPLKDLRTDMPALGKMIGSKTALVCLTHASNIFGGREDIEAAAELAHAAGAYLFTDDAQYAPTHGGSGALYGADACAFSGHKLGAPYCTGALYVRRALLGKLRPWRVGGGPIEDVTFSGGRYKVKYLGNYQGFEAGVQNYSGASALAVALARLEKCGFENIRSHVSGLVAGALEELRQPDARPDELRRLGDDRFERLLRLLGPALAQKGVGQHERGVRDAGLLVLQPPEHVHGGRIVALAQEHPPERVVKRRIHEVARVGALEMFDRLAGQLFGPARDADRLGRGRLVGERRELLLKFLNVLASEYTSILDSIDKYVECLLRKVYSVPGKNPFFYLGHGLRLTKQNISFNLNIIIFN